MLTEASPELFLEAYFQGLFPMADSADDIGYNFYAPHLRALLPIKELHIPKSLLKKVKKHPFKVRVNTDFEGVINECAKSEKGRESTWINDLIKETFIELHHLGFAHSVECWKNETLVGGLYGLAIGQVFCGESMFSRADNASKIALVHLCAHLYLGGFQTLDSQFINDHLKQFGVYEIPQEEYLDIIEPQMQSPSDFNLMGKSNCEILENYLLAR